MVTKAVKRSAECHLSCLWGSAAASAAWNTDYGFQRSNWESKVPAGDCAFPNLESQAGVFQDGVTMAGVWDPGLE